MKIFKLLIASLLILTFFSCGKDDASKSGNNGIADDWDLISLEYTGTSSAEVYGTAIVQQFVGTGKDIDVTMSFNDDNTYVSSGSYVVVLVTTTNGLSLTQEVPFTDFLGNGTYSYEEPIIMFSSTDGDSSGTVTELDANNLSININTRLSETNAGVTSQVEIDYTISLTR